jgi:hypothetical protein
MVPWVAVRIPEVVALYLRLKTAYIDSDVLWFSLVPHFAGIVSRIRSRLSHCTFL